MKFQFCLSSAAVLLAVLCCVVPIRAEKPALSTMAVPDGLGYNIHFTDAKPGEMEMIADSGATIVRMDLHWSATEREKGVYDFSAYDRLLESLEKHNIRWLAILCYENRFYDEGKSVHTKEGRTAFARWAAAAVEHFKGRNVIWEMFNEPNIQFWKPEPNPEKYVLLALEVGRAIRAVAPNELYVGPATSQIDLPFLEQCFKADLLEYWDAVSVHPYRQNDPETVIEEYAKLRYMIDKYAPKDKQIPILSAEWGYSSVWHNFDDERQGKYLPRQWMINLAMDVPISIWYDWHDDGTDPKEPEHHFGTTNHEYLKDQNPVYKPKDSYIAAKTFNETFSGFRYNKRLALGSEFPHAEDFVFVFDNGKEVKLAAWTTAKEPKTISIPSTLCKYSVVSYLGEKLPDLVAEENSLKLSVSDGPIYLTPEISDPFWNDIAKARSLPLVVYRNLSGPARFGQESLDISADTINPTRNTAIIQYTRIRATNPIVIGTPVPHANDLVVPIDNPSGEKYSVPKIEVAQIDGFELDETTRPLELKTGETSKILRFPFKTGLKGEYEFSVQTGERVLCSLKTYRLIDDFSKLDAEKLNATWNLHPDGDSKVGSEQKMEIADGRTKITYKFDEGWKFLRFFPKSDEMRKIDGKPKALGVLFDGEGIGGYVNVRFADSKGQMFQVPGGPIRDKKTYFFEFPLDGTKASHWGGPNDGVVHYPIRFDSIIVDGTRKACGPLSISIASPVLIYEK